MTIPRRFTLLLFATALPQLAPENVLAEPEARNTAPCVALAAYEIAARDPDSVQIVLPADHVIRPAQAFQRTLGAAVTEAGADDGPLLTFGIRPTFPATGYGYIEAGAKQGTHDGVDDVTGSRFHQLTR